MSKIFKTVAKIALPIVGNALGGPVGAALAGAAAGALGGGGLKGALLGGALSGLGAGVIGGAPTATGFGMMDSLNQGIYSGLSPLRSLGQSITGGIGDILSPLKSIFTGGTSSSTPGVIEDAVLKQSFPNQAAADAARAASGVASESSKGLFGRAWDAIGNPSINDLATGAALLQALNPQEPEGTLSQQEIVARMDADKAKQDASNAKFIASLNASPLQRTQTNPVIDYYNYGSKPEATFFDNVNGQQIQFKKGGRVKSNPSPLSAIGGQDDAISAKLSAGEYVIPADVVSGLGDGNTEAGAKKLDMLLKKIRQHRAPSMEKGKLPPKTKSPLAYIGEAA